MSLRSCCCALWIFLVAGSLALAQNIAAQAQRQPVPDFKGKTLQQVQTAALVPGTKRRLFAAISSQGPANGVVTAQTPAPGVYVMPGEVPLRLTLAAPPPGILQTFLQAFVNGQKNGQPNVQVPPVTGQNRTVASHTLETAHLRPVFQGNEAGLVAQQSPPAGTSVPKGTAVTLTLALPQTTVPLVVGKNLAEATAALNAASLRIGNVTGANTDTTTLVSLQTPPAGTQVDPGASVDLTLTAPAVVPPVPQVFVPNLIRLTPAQASALLASVGLRLGKVAGPKGRVGSQQPLPNTQVPSGTVVDIRLVAVPVLPPQPTAGTDTGPPVSQDTPPPGPVPQPPQPLHIPTWLVVLASVGGLGLVTAGTTGIVHHFLSPPSTAYSLHTAKAAPKTLIHNQPSLNWRLTVRDGRPAAQSIVDREPAVTRRRVQ